MRHLSPRTLLAALLAGNGAAAQQQAPPASPQAGWFPSPWSSGGPGGWDEAYAKAREFVSQLTLVEKVNLTTGTGWEADRCVGNTGSVPRLGFRAFCLEDGPLGVRYTDGNSAFPAGINAAATWSRDLIRRRGVAMGKEFRGKGVDVQLGPVAGALGRVPAGGRNWEGFSPDPYLTGVAIAETIEGIQSEGVIACAKHYILNEQEHYRGNVDVTVNDRTMHELYLWPFADAVRAGVGSFMCSYNKIGGAYACENAWTTNYLLKNELGFQGFLMSDWGAQHSTVESALTGLDMAMPGDGTRANPYGAWWGGALTEAVINGTVPQWRLDDMAVRIMAAYFKVNTGARFAPESRPEINFSAWTKPNESMGYLHPSSKQRLAEVNKHVNVQHDHAELIREMGAKSIVLLKNVNGTLPLRRPASVAVIGEDAQDNPDGPNACPERGCNVGTLAMAWGSGTAEFPYLVSPATALRRRAEADGTAFTNVEGNWDLEAAKVAAAGASVALVFANANAGENFITIDGNAGDRNNLTLWGGGDELVRAVASVNRNTVVVLHTVGPVVVEHIKEHPNVTAILWAGLPGQESGNSLVDVLYGAVNPQGKTPFTWGKRVEDYGAQVMYRAPSNPPAQNFTEGVYIDYRWFAKEGIAASYDFGFGLSYTEFLYSDIKVVPHREVAAAYRPSSGLTEPAPLVGGPVDKNVSANLAPEGFGRIAPYVYPWVVANTSARSPPGGGREDGDSGSVAVPRLNGAAQPVLPAGGAPGGNSGLYDVLYTVSVVVKNTGDVAGTEVVQLYVRLGGDNPFQVLRGFDDVYLEPGEAKPVTFNLTRRDVSNWNTATQNWEINDEEKFVFVSYSSVLVGQNATLPRLSS